MRNILYPLIILLGILTISCQKTPQKEVETIFNVPFEKIKLDNGLEVVFHIDRSDPVVAVALTAHVGSARELPGRTGFAHLFEHLLFLESENLGKGGLDKMSARIGGSGANGSTSRDRTNYFQTVPNDALEKMIWAESDKLGWFINTVTEPVLAKEKQVVKNEKRQSYDNRPYGHTSYVIDKNLYPEDHPYNWQVIGSLEDLQNATLQDVKDFFNRWYTPNNVTLTISGDFDVNEAKEWVHKYFDEIPSGEEVQPMTVRPGVLTETIKKFHEDNFARLPELTLTWPSVEQYHPDSYALDVLSSYFSQGKEAPLNQILIEDKQLTNNVSMFQRSSELAGQLQLRIRAYDGIYLDSVLSAVEKGFAKFESEGISQEDLDRIKAGQETMFYNGLSSVLGKGFQLAQYNIFAGDPGFIQQDIQNILDVTTDDVSRVYETYIKNKPCVATSFVPTGSTNLILTGSSKAEIVEEEIVPGAEETFDASQQAEYEKTPSSFDRSIEPPYGTTPVIATPDVWQATIDNGLKIFGIQSDEVPLVEFNLVIKGGQLLEKINKPGVANLVAQMTTKGTQNKTTAELESAIDKLGANIRVSATNDAIEISGNTLSRNYQQTMDLVSEMILEPRWDSEEFDLLKQSIASQIKQQEANPNAIAQNAFNVLVYGNEDIRTMNSLGTLASIELINLEDLKTYYQSNVSPSVATLHIVGDIEQSTVVESLEGLKNNWKSTEVTIPELDQPKPIESSQVYFYDVPNAKQSVLNIGYLALAETDPDFYPATILNYRLGGGGFASQLTQELREGKGYTYGVRSRFQGSTEPGPFMISSGVRTNVTLESTLLIKQILENYGQEFNESDLETTKSSMIKSNARAFETSRAKLSMLQDMSKYGWKASYLQDRIATVEVITVEEIQGLAKQYLNQDQMIWLVVGDAKTQLDRMEELGFGKAVLINDMTPPEQ
ncbi:M16 family metallopeptidase [Marinoscillum pacificum]|uniref:M16 family metallopeptidase n=1 Tax=Marinoscillum pacificum TaxID=392723 RepID=UPI0021570DC7|nr:pitrilysin family protein [Marinoscillum pacificum]